MTVADFPSSRVLPNFAVPIYPNRPVSLQAADWRECAKRRAYPARKTAAQVEAARLLYRFGLIGTAMSSFVQTQPRDRRYVAKVCINREQPHFVV